MKLLGLLGCSLVTLSTACVTEDLGSVEAEVTRGSTAVFTGTGNNWFNAANWSTRSVPGPNDDVILDGADDVILDGNFTSGPIRVRSITVRDDAQLEVHAAVFEAATESIEDNGYVIYRGSGVVIDRASDSDEGSGSTNPTAQSKRTSVLKSSFNTGLGGTTPASLAIAADGSYQLAAGAGHYATLTSDEIELGGELDVSTYYGFSPRPGDTFQIVTVNRSRTGEFANLPEGAIAACTNDNICLRISYRGGDGNDVTLTSELVAAPPATAKPVREGIAFVKRIDKSSP